MAQTKKPQEEILQTAQREVQPAGQVEITPEEFPASAPQIFGNGPDRAEPAAKSLAEQERHRQKREQEKHRGGMDARSQAAENPKFSGSSNRRWVASPPPLPIVADWCRSRRFRTAAPRNRISRPPTNSARETPFGRCPGSCERSTSVRRMSFFLGLDAFGEAAGGGSP